MNATLFRNALTALVVGAATLGSPAGARSLQAQAAPAATAVAEARAETELATAVLSDSDPERFEALRLLARLYHHEGKTRQALRSMLDAASQAVRLGELTAAAQTLVDASELAIEAGAPGMAWETANRAQELANSPRMGEGERRSILVRLESGEAVARAGSIRAGRSQLDERRTRIFLPSFTGAGG